MNIVFIGYRCSGKTSIGNAIAKRTNRDFYDTDDLIEQITGQSIEGIVKEDGWDRFRELEKRVVRKASEMKNAVISTGGGVVLDEDNIKCLKKSGQIIWLEGDADILMKRMEKDMDSVNTRPSLTGSDPIVETRKVLETRNTLYRKAAEIVINTDRLSVDEVVEKVLKAIYKIGG